MKFWIGAKDPNTHRAMNSRCETAKSPDAYVQQLRAPQSAGRTKSPSRGSFQLFDSQPEYQPADKSDALPDSRVLCWVWHNAPYTHYCTRPRAPSCPCDWKRPWNTSAVGPLTPSNNQWWLADYPNLILNKVTCTWACFKPDYGDTPGAATRDTRASTRQTCTEWRS